MTDVEPTDLELKNIIEELKKNPKQSYIDEFYDDSTIIFGKWYKNYMGDYYKYDDNGVAKKTPVSQDYESCFGLNITEKDYCNTFLEIMNSNKNQFSKDAIKDFLIKNPDNYFKSIEGNINELHPKIALRILQKFGFKKRKGNNNDWEITPVSRWLQGLAEEYFDYSDNKAEFDMYIKKNNKLLKFLDTLVHYINANPGILNKNYVASQEDIENYVRAELNRDSFQTKQPPYFIWVNSKDKAAMPIMYGSSRTFTKNNLRNLLKNLQALNTSGAQVGGYDNVYSYETNITNKIRQSTSTRLKNYLSYLNQLAASKNVIIDKYYINSLIDKMGVYEDKILNALATIQKFTENNKSFDYGTAISLTAMENYLDNLVKYSENSKLLERKIINNINEIANKINTSDKIKSAEISIDEKYVS